MSAPPRWTNTIGDMIITCQLVYHSLTLMSRVTKNSNWTTKASHMFYTANLFLAAVFTATGAYTHVNDPLPQETNNIWKLFLLTLSSTPILWPVVMQCALFPKMSRTAAVMLFSWFVMSVVFHPYVILGEVDLAPYLPAIAFKPIVLPGLGIFPDAILDGRGQGAIYGLPTDLLTSVPSYHGSGVFLHTLNFTIAAVHSLICCLVSDKTPPGLLKALILMVTGQLVMVPILVFTGVQACFDFWHLSIFTVMQLVFINLTPIITVRPKGKKGEVKEGRVTRSPSKSKKA